MDPDRIKPDAQVTVCLPRVITVLDYHQFTDMQNVINHDLGLPQVRVTDVGFAAPEYVGLIHVDTESHNQLVMELTEYYQQTEDAQ
jgi:hypothetical protein